MPCLSRIPETSRTSNGKRWTTLFLNRNIAEMDEGDIWKDRRAVLNGMLWVQRTGAPWADVPEQYPSYQTCHRRFQQWVRSRVMKSILDALALDLKARGVLDVEEAFFDGTFAPAKKGASKSEKQNVVREQRSWPSQTDTVFRSPCLLKAPRLTKLTRLSQFEAME